MIPTLARDCVCVGDWCGAKEMLSKSPGVHGRYRETAVPRAFKKGSGGHRRRYATVERCQTR
jgi:hypothetical protein